MPQDAAHRLPRSSISLPALNNFFSPLFDRSYDSGSSQYAKNSPSLLLGRRENQYKSKPPPITAPSSPTYHQHSAPLFRISSTATSSLSVDLPGYPARVGRMWEYSLPPFESEQMEDPFALSRPQSPFLLDRTPSSTSLEAPVALKEYRNCVSTNGGQTQYLNPLQVTDSDGQTTRSRCLFPGTHEKRPPQKFPYETDQLTATDSVPQDSSPNPTVVIIPSPAMVCRRSTALSPPHIPRQRSQKLSIESIASDTAPTSPPSLRDSTLSSIPCLSTAPTTPTTFRFDSTLPPFPLLPPTPESHIPRNSSSTTRDCTSFDPYLLSTSLSTGPASRVLHTSSPIELETSLAKFTDELDLALPSITEVSTELVALSPQAFPTQLRSTARSSETSTPRPGVLQISPAPSIEQLRQTPFPTVESSDELVSPVTTIHPDTSTATLAMVQSFPDPPVFSRSISLPLQFSSDPERSATIYGEGNIALDTALGYVDSLRSQLDLTSPEGEGGSKSGARPARTMLTLSAPPGSTGIALITYPTPIPQRRHSLPSFTRKPVAALPAPSTGPLDAKSPEEVSSRPSKCVWHIKRQKSTKQIERKQILKKKNSKVDDFDEHAPLEEVVLCQAGMLQVLDTKGQPVRFGRLFENQVTIVCFIRHFWCPMCQDYMRSIMRSVNKKELDAFGIRLVIIGNGSPALAKAYKEKVFKCPYDVYTDPTRALYRLLGMTRRTLNAGTKAEMGDYITHGSLSGVRMVASHALKMPLGGPGDMQQLGGEFILGPGYRSDFVHRMPHTRGHTSIATLVKMAVQRVKDNQSLGIGPPLGAPQLRDRNVAKTDVNEWSFTRDEEVNPWEKREEEQNDGCDQECRFTLSSPWRVVDENDAQAGKPQAVEERARLLFFA